uniref:Glycine-rich protein n=1 Tax=Chenopodium quinoa TaxID=63459 RepID=A0A803KN53_CHEQI
MGRAVSSKIVWCFTLLVVVGLLAMSLSVEGARDLKEEPKKGEKAVHPENFFGGFGGIFPSTGGAGFGSRTGLGRGSSVDFCSVPSLGCVRVEPTNPGSTGGSGGGIGNNTPLPFP